MLRRVLLACGFVSSLFYVAMTVFVASQWDGYSSVSQTVSELSAIDAPTRPLWVPLVTIYALLLTAFGWGAWLSANHNTRLRIVGALLVVHGVFGLVWPPMHQRAVLAAGGATWTDSMHLLWAAVTVFLMLCAMAFAASVLDKRFRTYTIVTALIQIAFGALTGISASRIAANLPTPWVGVWERVNIAAFLLWIVVLAFELWRLSPIADPSAMEITARDIRLSDLARHPR